MSTYNVVAAGNESTVVAEYEPQTKRSDAYQSEAALPNARMPTRAKPRWSRLLLRCWKSKAILTCLSIKAKTW